MKKKRNSRKDTIHMRLNEKLDQWQHRTAAFLNNKTKDWTPQKLKMALLAFCAVIGCASLYIAGSALRNGHGPPALDVHHLRRPETKGPASGDSHDSLTIQSNLK